MSAVYFSMSMNKQKWDSLPPDVQKAIMSVSGVEGSKFWGRNFFDNAETGVMARVKTGNHAFEKYTLPAAELARWRKLGGEPLWNNWIKKMEGRGNKDAQKILNTAMELLGK